MLKASETKVKYGVERYAVVWISFEGNHGTKLEIGPPQNITSFWPIPEKNNSKEIDQN